MIERAADIVPLIISGFLFVLTDATTPPTNITHFPAIKSSGGGTLFNKSTCDNFDCAQRG